MKNHLPPNTSPLADTDNFTHAWYALSEQEVLDRLQSAAEGLSAAEAEKRQLQYGLNSIPHKEPPGLAMIFLHQFMSPLIYILLIASGASLLLGETKDALFIFVVLLSNAAIGAAQEWKAEKSAASLHSLLKIYARVKRDGIVTEVSAEELVPGDIVLVETGLKIPADIRLLQTRNLSIDESLLTGESVAVEKNILVLPENTSLGQRSNMIFAGSTVMAGRGMGIVVATGQTTEIGSIANAVMFPGTNKPPLVLRMEKFARQLSIGVVLACLMLGGLALAGNMPYAEVFFLAVALAVSAIPEGLPVAITVTLAISSKRMASRNVIVRKLTAVEGLGSCTCIASDKTGTLTINKQTVDILSLPGYGRLHVSGEGYTGEGKLTTDSNQPIDPSGIHQVVDLAKAAILCSEADLKEEKGRWYQHGDAVDVALLALGYKIGLTPQKIREQTRFTGSIPYESERKFAANFYQDEQRDTWVAVKGALETLLPFCSYTSTANGVMDINPESVEQEALALAQDGYRVLAIATGKLNLPSSQDTTLREESLTGLTFLGLVGLIDPLRPEAKEAIAICHRAGVSVVMITGDHPATALAIARQLGIAQTQNDIITGMQLEQISSSPHSPEFLDIVKKARVFARVSPLQKLRIVEALITIGHFVAVTGDGVNDAPALRKAHIGVAMGSGTDVAKDTASIILTDDNFASLVAGIEEGRYSYDNIRKVIYLLLATGSAEIMLFFLSLLAGLPLPLVAVQLLWLNLVTNGIQDVALAFEGGEAETMRRPPRKPQEGIFNRLMIEQSLIAGSTITLLTFGAWCWLLNSGTDEFAARNFVFLLMVLLQNFHVFNCRSEHLSVFKISPGKNPLLIFGVIGAQVIHLFAMHIPLMQDVLKISPISFYDWISALVLSSTIIGIMEVFKILQRTRTP